MTATILKFIPRPNPKRETQQAVNAMVDMIWAPFFACAGIMDMDLYARGLAIDTAPSEVLHTSDYIAPDDDCA